MGSGISTRRIVKSNDDNIHCDSRKSSDLDRVLRSVRSTSAFLKYLDRTGNGKDCFLKLYLDPRKSTTELQELQSRCDSISHNTSDQAISWPRELSNLISELLLKQSNTNKSTDVGLLEIKEFCCLHLTLELPGFLASHEYSKRLRHNHKSRFENSLETTYALKNNYKNVLIIDDSPQNSQFMTTELKADGHQVCQANHGWIGVHLASLNHFDIILIDLAMNTMDPYEVIKQIKSHSKSINGMPASTLFVGLNYSEYDAILKNHDIMYSLHVGSLLHLTSASKFIAEFNASHTLYEEILKNCGNKFDGETCNSSFAESVISY